MRRAAAGAARGLLLALLLAAPGTQSAAQPATAPLAAPQDDVYREALATLYAGSTDAALLELAALAAAHPDDPMAPYLEALALNWKIEQRPDSRALDPRLEQTVARAVALADRRLAADAADARARLARGGAHAARARLALFRYDQLASARYAVRMREDLLALTALVPGQPDAEFGLGLYDYYADVLPRLLRLVRFVLGIPGGDRVRGLARIEAARAGSLFSGVELQAQLFEIYAFFEDAPDRALPEMQALRARFPGSPLWGLKLATLQRDLGLYREAIEVARAMVAAAERGHPNYGPPAEAQARLLLAEALLLELRPQEAVAAFSAIEAAALDARRRARAALLHGRALELEGRREAALPLYREAERTGTDAVRREAQQAWRTPLARERRAALPHLAAGRRLWQAGHVAQAAAAYRMALAAWPASPEATLGVAEALLAEGRPEWPARVVPPLASAVAPEPPWLGPWARLLRARLFDLAGERERALELYRAVASAPLGRRRLAQAAAAGRDAPYTAPSSSDYSR